MADRCIKWERPYASTGQGHRPGPTYEYEAEKDTSSGFDHRYIAEVGERDDWDERRWYGTLWRDRDFRARPSWWVSADPDYDPRGIEDRSVRCSPSVATGRSCRRALDRDVVARPPIVTAARRDADAESFRQWFDKIAPTGPWECVEYEDG